MRSPCSERELDHKWMDAKEKSPLLRAPARPLVRKTALVMLVNPTTAAVLTLSACCKTVAGPPERFGDQCRLNLPPG